MPANEKGRTGSPLHTNWGFHRRGPTGVTRPTNESAGVFFEADWYYSAGVIGQDEREDSNPGIFDRGLRRDASALATSRRSGGRRGRRQRRGRSIRSAQSGVEQGGNRRRKTCWRHNVWSRRTPRTHL